MKSRAIRGEDSARILSSHHQVESWLGVWTGVSILFSSSPVDRAQLEVSAPSQEAQCRLLPL